MMTITYFGHEVEVVKIGDCGWDKCSSGDDCVEFKFIAEKLKPKERWRTVTTHNVNRGILRGQCDECLEDFSDTELGCDTCSWKFYDDGLLPTPTETGDELETTLRGLDH
ncbi:MAG: hypothetical protein KJN71_09500 [Acidimicrobiia bacterium]|nr:hypothetical protein [Acidimicrobiia bacterium]